MPLQTLGLLISRLLLATLWLPKMPQACKNLLLRHRQLAEGATERMSRLQPLRGGCR
ncbi:hypothetical protein HDC30_005529 [Pseudomonas sp. JAI115]|jgi:hypothetical protein|nr:hypothetical protein [Pseudomonas sp. JAI115]